MKTINIKGKPYVMVNERVKEFKLNYKGWALTTEMLQCNDESCIFKAIVLDENGIIKATGHAQEDRASSMINKTSYIENAETSAVGRALGFLGIGIDESIASAEEVNIAIAKQNNNETCDINTFNFGEKTKYPKQTIAQVFEQNPSYLEWVVEKSTYPESTKNAIRDFLKEQKNNDDDKLPWEIEI